jgi:hypothetical protein
MPRLFVHVEGQTEQTFVDEILRPHLLSKGYWDVTPGILGNPRRRGGIPSWAEARRDIARHLKEDRGCVATTMVDYYGLPSSGNRAWPGRVDAINAENPEKAGLIENALMLDLESEMGKRFDARRFVPFVDEPILTVFSVSLCLCGEVPCQRVSASPGPRPARRSG